MLCSNNATLKPWFSESDADEVNERARKAYVSTHNIVEVLIKLQTYERSSV